MTSQQKPRSPFLYAIPAVLVILAGMYFATRPPAGGVFCSPIAGCYDVNFGSGSDGTIAFYLPGGERSRQFPLVRDQSGDYSASFMDNERLRLTIREGDRLVRDDDTTFTRTPPKDVPGILDAVRKAQAQEAEKRTIEESTKAVADAKAQQAKIASLLAQLASAQDEATRAAVQKQLDDEQRKILKDGKSPGSAKPCNCNPSDPLCSCL